jgi:hypothetical protein
MPAPNLASIRTNPVRRAKGAILMNTSRLTSMTAISAIAAGLLFMLIQPLHPADTLASVTTGAWVAVHVLTLVMLTLFVVGVSGIYASQVERMGLLGLAGYLVLVAGLLLTATGAVIEAFVEPVVALAQPAFVEGMLGMVEGHPTGVDLGAIPAIWSASSACFLGGTILFGIASFRTGILSRWASAVFALGLFVVAPTVGLLGLSPRLAAFPIGLGLAWLGCSLLTRGRRAAVERAATRIAEATSASAA